MDTLWVRKCKGSQTHWCSDRIACPLVWPPSVLRTKSYSRCVGRNGGCSLQRDTQRKLRQSWKHPSPLRRTHVHTMLCQDYTVQPKQDTRHAKMQLRCFSHSCWDILTRWTKVQDWENKRHCQRTNLRYSPQDSSSPQSAERAQSRLLNQKTYQHSSRDWKRSQTCRWRLERKRKERHMRTSSPKFQVMQSNNWKISRTWRTNERITNMISRTI